jgi:hypothetical protein
MGADQGIVEHRQVVGWSRGILVVSLVCWRKEKVAVA